MPQTIKDDVCEILKCKGHSILLSSDRHSTSGLPNLFFLNSNDLGSTLQSVYLERVVRSSARDSTAPFCNFSPFIDKAVFLSEGERSSVYILSWEASFNSSGKRYHTCTSLRDWRGGGDGSEAKRRPPVTPGIRGAGSGDCGGGSGIARRSRRWNIHRGYCSSLVYSVRGGGGVDANEAPVGETDGLRAATVDRSNPGCVLARPSPGV